MSQRGAKIIPFPQRRPPRSPAPATLSAFHDDVIAGRAAAAGRGLAALLGVSEDVAQRAADHYARALAEQPELVTKAMRLRRELESSATNNALVLLMDCFGLTIGEAVYAYGNLRAAFT